MMLSAVIPVANWLCAAVIFAAVATRLAHLERSGRSAGCRARWNAWVLAHVLIGLGAFAVMLGPLYGYTTPVAPEVAINAGLALYFGLRWRRRSDDA